MKDSKFLFDLDFETPAPPEEPAEPEVVEMPPVTYSEDELNAAREQAYKDGHAAGESSARTAQVALLERTVDRLVEQASTLLAREAERAALHDAATMDVLRMIVAKVLPKAFETYGPEEILAVVTHTLAEMRHEPRIVIRLSEGELETLRPMIESRLASQARTGQVIFIGESGLGAGDCRIEWAEGGIERNEQKLWSEIERTLMRHVPALYTAPQASDTDLPASMTTTV